MCFSCHRYALASAATLNLAVQVNLRRNKTLGSCCGFGRYAYLDVQVSLPPNKTSRSCCPGVRLKPLIHLSAFPDAAVRRMALRKARRILETPFQVKDTKGFETSIPCVVSETAARSRFAFTQSSSAMVKDRYPLGDGLSTSCTGTRATY